MGVFEQDWSTPELELARWGRGGGCVYPSRSIKSAAFHEARGEVTRQGDVPERSAAGPYPRMQSGVQISSSVLGVCGRAGQRQQASSVELSELSTRSISSMSRQSMAPNRNLSLTEELEKLEQSITLTLQGKAA